MKKLLVVLIMLGLFIAPAYSANIWRVKHGKAVMNLTWADFNGLCMGDTASGWAVGSALTGRGAILRIGNAGTKVWLQNSGVVTSLWSVSCYDTVRAMAVGDKGTILKTTNAGVTWVKQTAPTGYASFSFRDVEFLNAAAAYAVGYNDQTQHVCLIKTGNGGTTWTMVYDEAALGNPFAFSFAMFPKDSVPGRLTFVGGYDGYIRVSPNKGTFITYGTPPTGLAGGMFFGVTAPDSTHRFACGSNGVVIKTTTASDSADAVVSTSPDSAIIYVAGHSWGTTYTGGIATFHAPDTAGRRIVLSANNSITLYTNTMLAHVFVSIDSAKKAQDTLKLGWPSAGTLLTNYIGGVCWVKKTGNDSIAVTITRVAADTVYTKFQSFSNGATAPDSYRVYRPVPGTSKIPGLTVATQFRVFSNPAWTSVSTGYVTSLYSIDHAHYGDVKDISNLYVVGANGTILKTTNGGTAWSTVYTGGGYGNLYRIAVVDTGHIYVVGREGLLLKYGGR